ncbi:ABC transporter permease [Bacteroides sp. 51]|uniref:ABC transporter permease n=1 Tax=Bacteroides sp. 51 TaxID=2302938 RepID=UPI0013D76583|nr:ABC transporter permease [Bacteroides sp. 51]NDV83407.1 hypothetical protein [Bacteroides sp. 51]
MFNDFVIEIYQAVKGKPTRSVLTGIGVAWGILILILLLGVGSGFEKGVFSVFNGFSLTSTYLYTFETSLPYKGTNTNTKIEINSQDIQILKKCISGIDYISPEVSKLDQIFAGIKSARYETRGVYPEYFRIKLLEADKGRVLNDLDMAEKRKIVLIGKNIADILFKNENPIGKDIRIGKEFYKIVGVIKNTLLNSSEERVIYIPYSTYLDSHPEAEQFSIVLFSTNKKSSLDDIKKRIRTIMGKKYIFSPVDDTVFYFSSFEEQVAAFTNLFTTIRKVLWFMGLSTLISGIIGVGNIIYASVKERTREIGIRKSIGATASSIKIMFIGEAIGLTSIAGAIGLFIGWILLEFLGLLITKDTIMIEKPGIDISTSIAAVLILVISGGLAGLIPAIYASHLVPVEAIKEEN